MGIEVTRVHLEISAEEYDIFRAWQKEKQSRDEAVHKKITELKNETQSMATDILIALEERAIGTGVFVKDKNSLYDAYKKACDFFENKQNNGGL